MHRRLLGCSYDAPLPKWSCCSVAPVAVETADCITRWESVHLSIHSSAYSSDSHHCFFFCPPHPPFVLIPPPFTSPSRHSFLSKTLKVRGKKKPDRSSVLHRAEIVTHASEHSDITVAFPLTSIQIYKGVSEYSLCEGVLRWEQKENSVSFSRS